MVTTGFGQRSGVEAAQVSRIADYEPFEEHALGVFAKLRSSRTATSAQVAEAIFQAATDCTSRLRYVATQDIEPLVKLRRETSEERYMELMRKQFGQ
ncbi:MAG TPA: hypothetical protein VH083_11945 [Myxococcales bacterium]|nr:hypothetical protein [Myxococcales bacterium]